MTVTDRRPPTGMQHSGPARHRGHGWRLPGVLGLFAALLAAGALLALPPADRTPAAPVVLTADRAWPGAQRADTPGSLRDGPAYSPVLFVDARTSIGTAPSPDGAALRLVRRAADGAVRELRRLPLDRSPHYGGFTLAGDQLAWAESVENAAGRARSEIWAADLRTGAAPRRLTADTGAVAFFNSQYDMIINAGRVHWVAVAPGDKPVTELRSVPLAGGKVTVRPEPGAWALTAWPWLVSAGSGDAGPVQLRDLAARKITTVESAAAELVTCSPAWCRVLVLTGDGPARIDLMRPDGSQRQRIAGGTATAAVLDVAVLDRFEMLSVAGPDTGPLSSQQLLVYDLSRKQTVEVSTGVGTVVSRGGVLWWSTGEEDALVWHTIDLRTA